MGFFDDPAYRAFWEQEARQREKDGLPPLPRDPSGRPVNQGPPVTGPSRAMLNVPSLLSALAGPAAGAAVTGAQGLGPPPPAPVPAAPPTPTGYDWAMGTPTYSTARNPHEEGTAAFQDWPKQSDMYRRAFFEHPDTSMIRTLKGSRRGLVHLRPPGAAAERAEAQRDYAQLYGSDERRAETLKPLRIKTGEYERDLRERLRASAFARVLDDDVLDPSMIERLQPFADEFARSTAEQAGQPLSGQVGQELADSNRQQILGDVFGQSDPGLDIPTTPQQQMSDLFRRLLPEGSRSDPEQQAALLQELDIRKKLRGTGGDNTAANEATANLLLSDAVSPGMLQESIRKLRARGNTHTRQIVEVVKKYKSGDLPWSAAQQKIKSLLSKEKVHREAVDTYFEF